jgi:hypothetical protein
MEFVTKHPNLSSLLLAIVIAGLAAAIFVAVSPRPF